MAEWNEAHSFQSVFEFLGEKHDKPGAIKRACKVVEDCLISNKYVALQLHGAHVCLDGAPELPAVL
jgi:hypothetical protein